MVSFFRKLQLVFASTILIATSIAFVLEILHMVEIRDVNLPDLLLLFIYLEVIGMVTSYWRTQTIRLTYPLFIAITALSRLIILQKKDIELKDFENREWQFSDIEHYGENHEYFRKTYKFVMKDDNKKVIGMIELIIEPNI